MLCAVFLVNIVISRSLGTSASKLTPSSLLRAYGTRGGTPASMGRVSVIGIAGERDETMAPLMAVSWSDASAKVRFLDSIRPTAA